MRDSERFGRYLEAVRHAVAPYGPWGPKHDAAAHAVMAVADAEQATQRGEWVVDIARAWEETDRLRSELESANGQIEARRIELLRVNERHAAEDAHLRAVPDPSWPRRAWDLGLLHKGGDPHHCPTCLAQPEPPADFICPSDNAEVLANPQPPEPKDEDA